MINGLGYILAMLVTTVGTGERSGSKELLAATLGHQPRLRKVCVDGGISGPYFANYAAELRAKLEIEVVKPSDTAQRFEVLPKRLVLERTFGWLMQCRRLVRDYERTVSSATAWIHVAMIRLMLRRLA